MYICAHRIQYYKIMINEANYSPVAMKHVTEIIPRGEKKKIIELMAKQGETAVTVDNVWRGFQYKKNIVDAIVAVYRKTLRKHSQKKAAA